MAIDTAAKRQSALSFGLPFMKGLIPDGDISTGDRQSMAYSYSGILAAVIARAITRLAENVLKLIFYDEEVIISEYGTNVVIVAEYDTDAMITHVLQERL